MSGFASISRGGAGGGAGAGNAAIDNAGSTGQFGETLVSQLSAASQATFAIGLNAVNFVTRSIGAGSSVTSFSGSAYLQSGTATTGSAAVLMKKGVTYRPGQGSLFRGTAIFGTPVANTYQLIGFGNTECGYHFGYNGLNFGIHHFPDGYREVRKLVISAGVATSTNVTVTLNGESKTYSIAGGGTVNQTSWEISQQDWSNVGGGWVAEAYDGTIYFIALRTGTRSGAYSASGVGLGVTSFTQFIPGASPNATFVTQSAWNIDTLDGNGPSRMVLDPHKGNVYQIGFQYLGFGNARFAIEDPQTGQFQTCHMIRNANARLTPVLKDPHVTGLWTATNNGSTISTHMTGTSGAIFVEGNILRNIGPAFSIASPDVSVNAEQPILSVRADRIFGSNAGYSEMSFSNITISVEASGGGGRFATIRIYKNLRLTGPVNFTNINATQSIASYDTAATGYTANQNTLLGTYVIGFGQNVIIDLKGDSYTLSTGEILTVTAQGDASTPGVTCALNWFEDQ